MANLSRGASACRRRVRRRVPPQRRWRRRQRPCDVQGVRWRLIALVVLSDHCFATRVSAARDAAFAPWQRRFERMVCSLHQHGAHITCQGPSRARSLGSCPASCALGLRPRESRLCRVPWTCQSWRSLATPAAARRQRSRLRGTPSSRLRWRWTPGEHGRSPLGLAVRDLVPARSSQGRSSLGVSMFTQPPACTVGLLQVL